MIDASRYPRLSRIDRPADLRTFEPTELRAIADELRGYLIESVGKSGGAGAACGCRTQRGKRCAPPRGPATCASWST